MERYEREIFLLARRDKKDNKSDRYNVNYYYSIICIFIENGW